MTWPYMVDGGKYYYSDSHTCAFFCPATRLMGLKVLYNLAHVTLKLTYEA